ncbi:MAG: diguanylate cyclase, partial [Myxococcota bacterium]
MAKPATGKARRRSANERYRQGFLSQAATELREFALLLAEEPDAQESVAFELHRLGETAETLELAAVARAANDAADELTNANAGVRALRRVANAIRHTGGRLRFGPLMIVGASKEQEAQILADAELCCEPVFLFDDLQAFASGLHTEQPTAVVLPAEATDAVGQLVTRENFPVLVHGPPEAWEKHAAAMAAGAHGFLVDPFTLADVTRLARWRAQQAEERFEVLVLADPGEACDQMVQSLQQVGVAVVTLSDPRELAGILETGTPKAVVLSAIVAGYPALPLAQLVRSHPRCNHLPILVSGRPDDPAALRAIGVDDVMRTDAQPLQAAQRVRDRVVRTQGLAWERDPVTGLPNRLGVLNLLDAELAIASRNASVLSVALLEVEGLPTAIEAYGAGAVHHLRQLLISVFRAHLRRTDAFGELSVGELLVAMPGCTQQVAARRIDQIVDQFAERVKGEQHLANLSLAVGVADTLEGLRTVA